MLEFNGTVGWEKWKKPSNSNKKFHTSNDLDGPIIDSLSILVFKLLKIRINHSHVLNSSLFTTLLEWQDMYNGCDNSRQMCADNPFQKAFYKSVIWDAVLYIVSGWVELSTPIMRHRIVYSKWLSWVVDCRSPQQLACGVLEWQREIRSVAIGCWSRAVMYASKTFRQIF